MSELNQLAMDCHPSAKIKQDVSLMPNFIIEPWNGIACGNLFLEKSSHMTRDVGYF